MNSLRVLHVADVHLDVKFKGLPPEKARNLANIKRNFEKSSNKKLSDSSWYERLTPELVAFLKLCVTHAIEELALEQTKVLNEKLSKFQDVLIQDSTIIRLHKSLAKKLPAARSNSSSRH